MTMITMTTTKVLTAVLLVMVAATNVFAFVVPSSRISSLRHGCWNPTPLTTNWWLHSSATSDDLPSSSSSTTTTTTKTTIKEIPGRRTSPRFLSFLFDDSIKLLSPKTMGTYQRTAAEKYQSPIFKTNIFFQNTVVITTKEYMDQVFFQESSNKGSLIPAFPPHHQKLFGPHSIIVQDGEPHARLRRLLQPTLSPVAIQSYQQLIESSVTNFITSLQQESIESNEPIVLVPRIRAFFVSIAVQILLGTTDDDSRSSPLSIQEQKELAAELTTWGKGLLAPPISFIPWSTSAKAFRARKRIAIKLQSLIDDERTKLKQQQEEDPQDQQQNQDPQKPQPMGLLRRLVTSCDPETGEYLTDEDIIDNVLTLVFAGSDTTASAATSLWMALSLYPNLKSMIGDDDGDATKEENDPTSSTSTKVDTLIQKILNVYPPAPFAMRTVQKSITLQDTTTDENNVQYVIPNDWQIVYGFYSILENQRLEQQVSTTKGDGDESTGDWLLEDPSTTSSSSSSQSSPSSSNAFGGGPRMCPGRFLAVKELQAFAKVLARSDLMEWELEPNDQDTTQRYTPGYFPNDGLSIRFISNNK